GRTAQRAGDGVLRGVGAAPDLDVVDPLVGEVDRRRGEADDRLVRDRDARARVHGGGVIDGQGREAVGGVVDLDVAEDVLCGPGTHKDRVVAAPAVERQGLVESGAVDMDPVGFGSGDEGDAALEDAALELDVEASDGVEVVGGD